MTRDGRLQRGQWRDDHQPKHESVAYYVYYIALDMYWNANYSERNGVCAVTSQKLSPHATSNGLGWVNRLVGNILPGVFYCPGLVILKKKKNYEWRFYSLIKFAVPKT
ncbi:hypothetical protein AVEN_93122-1 [Araneus ventricosus]|uniref:Uncharacterized protein n=1 Tax=Araneus ventricosus TaxID=182803 RepID=A0A4Y2V468_ARAVE|nr:hypothetical protein AVEN_93122-1 [Araneus ventricosus]